jgi:predicted MPP superfamily phosphohydrolase
MSILGGAHSYFWFRLVRETQLAPPYRFWATLLCVALASLVPLSLMAPRLLPRSMAGFASWPGYIWIGLMLMLFAALLATDLARLVFMAGRSLIGASPMAPDKQLALVRVVALAVCGFAVVAGVYSVVQGLRPPALKQLTIALPKLPASLAGTKLVQLTDLHIGATKSKDFAEDVVRRTNALKPDIILLTGDIVEGRFGSARADVQILADLKARLGVYMVTGNHEYYSGLAEWLPELERLGIKILRNRHVTLDADKDGGWVLAGIDDWKGDSVEPGQGPDMERALNGIDPQRPVILLSHQPKAMFDAARAGVGLVLSGHTHGGQIWPFGIAVRLQQRSFLQGLYKVEGSQLYVSPGTGYWGPPMRLGTRAEITHITLVPGT